MREELRAVADPCTGRPPAAQWRPFPTRRIGVRGTVHLESNEAQHGLRGGESCEPTVAGSCEAGVDLMLSDDEAYKLEAPASESSMADADPLAGASSLYAGPVR